jgi:outer membrane protein TolC
MLPKRTLAMLVSASLSAGCAIGPDYVRPDMPLPERYLGQAAVDQRHATASADLVAWWTGFGDPQLTRFVILALEQNLDLAQAPARVAQARAGLGAANAALLPSGNINGQAARTYQSVETPLGQVLDSTPDFDRYGNAYEVNLGASWELDLFGGLRRGREAALAEYQASEADATATQLAVAAQAVDIYISIRGLQARLAVSNARIGVAIAEYYPKLSLSGLIGSATSVSGGSLFSNCASQAAGMLGLRWRLFDSGCISAQIHLARGQEAEVLACLSACNRGRRKCLLGSGYRTCPGEWTHSGAREELRLRHIKKVSSA